MSYSSFQNLSHSDSLNTGRYPNRYSLKKKMNVLKSQQKKKNDILAKIDLIKKKIPTKIQQSQNKGKRFAFDIDQHSTASSDEEYMKRKKLIRYKTQQNYDLQNSLNQKNSLKLTNFLFFLKKLVCSATLQKIITKLNNHFSNLSSSDKYIRMIYSLMKLHRSTHQQNNLGQISKQLLLARRVIRWHSKYDTIRQIFNTKNSLHQNLFKLFQLIGDFFDLGAFWLKLFQPNYPQLKPYTQTLTTLESDFYFYECCIWLIKYSYRFILNLIQLWKCEANLLNQHFEEPHQKKINKELTKIRNQLKSNGLRILKYIFDCRTSYQNYSKKIIQLSPITGSIYGILSSSIGIYLMWS